MTTEGGQPRIFFAKIFSQLRLQEYYGSSREYYVRVTDEGVTADARVRLKRDQTHARETYSAPQSTAASAAGIQATFICGGFFG